MDIRQLTVRQLKSLLSCIYTAYDRHLSTCMQHVTGYFSSACHLSLHMCFNVMCLIIFGKKLIRAYVCIMYVPVVPNQNKVFVFHLYPGIIGFDGLAHKY